MAAEELVALFLAHSGPEPKHHGQAPTEKDHYFPLVGHPPQPVMHAGLELAAAITFVGRHSRSEEQQQLFQDKNRALLVAMCQVS